MNEGVEGFDRLTNAVNRVGTVKNDKGIRGNYLKASRKPGAEQSGSKYIMSGIRKR